MRRVTQSVLALTLVAVAVFGASPAVATNPGTATEYGVNGTLSGYFTIRDPGRPWLCLHAAAGDVGVKDCNHVLGSRERWFLNSIYGTIYNEGERQCLTLLPGWEVGVRSCGRGRYQYWDAWDLGWTRERIDGVCLTRIGDPPTDVHATFCSTSRQDQRWDWVTD